MVFSSSSHYIPSYGSVAFLSYCLLWTTSCHASSSLMKYHDGVSIQWQNIQYAEVEYNQDHFTFHIFPWLSLKHKLACGYVKQQSVLAENSTRLANNAIQSRYLQNYLWHVNSFIGKLLNIDIFCWCYCHATYNTTRSIIRQPNHISRYLGQVLVSQFNGNLSS